jgi:putative DNA primase/helicase
MTTLTYTDEARTAALAYATRGLRVIALHTILGDGSCSCGRECGSPGKHPRFHKAILPNGLQSATTDPDVIEDWWDTWPGANLGVCTGNGLFVLDVDPGHGGDDSLALLQQTYGTLPDTVTCLTGGGGLHLWFTTTTPIGNSAGLLGKGLDIRGDGGYVVMPPSLHVSGRQYLWEGASHPDDIAIAPSPAWLIELLTTPRPATRSANGVLLPGLLGDPPLIEGNRNHALFQIASSHRHAGMDEDDIYDRLLAENERCRPEPLPDRELRAIARSVMRYEPGISLETDPPPAPSSDDTTLFDTLPLTERGNADRLLLRYGPQLRYTVARGWLVYDGQRWAEDDGQRARMSKAVARELWSSASRASEAAQRKAFANWAKTSEGLRNMESSAVIASSDTSVRVGIGVFDRHPELVNCQNGIVDLTSGGRRDHDPELLLTKIVPTAYDPTARCPRWIDFLTEIMDGDTDMLDYLQRVCGYWLTGETGEQVVWFFWGDGANGKSTLLSVIRAVFGDYVISTQASTFAEQKTDSVRNDIARLNGARLVTASEGTETRRLNEALIKQLTGGDPVTARFLHREYFEFTPTFKTVLATNHKPNISGTDAGIWRRIHLVPFSVEIPPERRNPHLAAELIESEGQGILAWCIAGAKLWRSHGLAAPEIVRSATDEYRAESDHFGTFIQERCVIGPTLSETTTNIYTAYRLWCEQNGRQPRSAQMIGRELTRRKFIDHKGHAARWRLGIALQPNALMEKHNG